MKLSHKKHEINVGGKKIDFFNQEIACAYDFGELSIVVLKADYPQKDKCYNNVLAIDNANGIIIWEVELDENKDFNNPYEAASDAGAYLIFFKANSDKVPVNKLTGKIIKNIDLMAGNRPW